MLLTTVLAGVSYAVGMWLSRLGGLVIILFGLHLLGIVRIGFLQQEHSLRPKKRFGVSYVTSFVFGAAFAVGWSPCVGAVLGSVLALSVAQPGLSFALLMAYSLGLGIPFLLVGILSTQAIDFIKRFGAMMRYFNIIVGVLLVVLGILVFAQALGAVAGFGLAGRLLKT